MGIGFQSFGGMLTGGDEAPPAVEETTAQKIEENIDLKDHKEKLREEIDGKEISYNDAIKE